MQGKPSSIPMRISRHASGIGPGSVRSATNLITSVLRHVTSLVVGRGVPSLNSAVVHIRRIHRILQVLFRDLTNATVQRHRDTVDKVRKIIESITNVRMDVIAEWGTAQNTRTGDDL